MANVNNNFNSLVKSAYNFTVNTKKATTKNADASNKTDDKKNDEVKISNSTKDSFEKIFAEFKANVPDRTSTIEEKELALEYIDKILKSDAEDDVKGYWTQKATEIKGEIARIKSEQAQSTDETQDGKLPEWKDYYNKYMSKIPDSTPTIESKKDALENIAKFLEAKDIPADIASYWRNMANVIEAEMNSMITKEKNEEKANNVDKTKNDKIDSKEEEVPSFEEIYFEMLQKVPDVTTTVEEKELALEYIDKIQESDANDAVKSYWADKAEVIKREIAGLNDKGNSKNDKSLNEVWTMISSYGDSLKTDKEKEALKNILSQVAISENATSFEKLFWQNKVKDLV